MTTALDRARDFLAYRRVAVVGVSRNGKDLSREIFRELGRRGYQAVAVNPAMTQVEGAPCWARLADIHPPVEWALLFTPPRATEEVVVEALAAGVRRIWMHRGAGAGAGSDAALAFCRAHGIEVVAGLCPFMALPGAGLPHRVHGFFRRHARPRPEERSGA